MATVVSLEIHIADMHSIGAIGSDELGNFIVATKERGIVDHENTIEFMHTAKAAPLSD